MSIPGIGAVQKAAKQKLSGQEPGRWQAFVASVAAGTATAVLTYKLLRG